MVMAQLSYNPYLQETKVSFNGNPPRINSLVEKYSSRKLQAWIDELPRIFYDEMNGYDFDLAFFGTDLDFAELRRSFARAGVGPELVRLFHKGNLGSRREKAQEIAQLIAWLDENPSKRFDWKSFYDCNRELFESVHSFVVVGNLPIINDPSMQGALFEDIAISVDGVESADELGKTDLSSTPILIVLDRRTSSTRLRDLKVLLGRDDVAQNQMFFLIDHDLEKTERVIRDLGVKDPQIVSLPNDERIERYLEIYPVSEFIHGSIEALRRQVEELGNDLEEENQQSELANRDVHETIKDLEDTLARLKSSADLFSSRSNLDYPIEFNEAKSRLSHEIGNWRVKKTKINRVDEAEQLAYEYEASILQQFGRFRQEINQVYFSKCCEVRSSVEEWYKRAHCDEEFAVDVPAEPPSLACSLPTIAINLIGMKTERYVTPKGDFFESFGKLFSGSSFDAPQEPVLETVFNCEKWRSYAESVMSPIADDFVREAFAALAKHLDQLSEAYLAHIGDLIDDVQAEKERVSAQLSEGERLLQAENDWHAAFRDKLKAIERF